MSGHQSGGPYDIFVTTETNTLHITLSACVADCSLYTEIAKNVFRL